MEVSCRRVSYKRVSLPLTVARLVKYIGYGNAAGFLAKRGALLGGVGNSDLSSTAQYSSDEDSDTEEYEKFKPQ